ncbi:MAG: hypothetical protein K0R28_4798, partial [Paenibacillus sp.]|nr:hypothetical protein [Paenibacillus sp.]
MNGKRSIVIAGMTIAALLAGCSGNGTGGKVAEQGGDSGAPKKDDIAAKIAEATSKPVVINVFENSPTYTQEQFMELYGNQIRKKYPNMSFKLYSSNKDNGGGTLPDLIAQGVPLDLIKVSGASFYTLMANNKL